MPPANGDKTASPADARATNAPAPVNTAVAAAAVAALPLLCCHSCTCCRSLFESPRFLLLYILIQMSPYRLLVHLVAIWPNSVKALDVLLSVVGQLAGLVLVHKHSVGRALRARGREARGVVWVGGWVGLNKLILQNLCVDCQDCRAWVVGR